VLHVTASGQHSTHTTPDAVVADLAPRLLRYCRARTPDAAAAKEIAQDSLTAPSHWQRHGPPASPDAFVFAIARRRAWRVVVARRLRTPLAFVSAQADTRANPERQALARSECEHVLTEIRRLPGRDREALLLVAAAGLDADQAARALGIAATAFRMRLSRARRRLTARATPS
jgi:DNA-directed RNA polymerase specialized sigma24 family protein